MAYEIRMGIPEMEKLWNELRRKNKEGTAGKAEKQLYKKWGNALKKLSENPMYFWVYGPEQQQITIIGLEPHPEDKKNGAYDRINLSDLE